MNLYELNRDEGNAVYQQLAVENTSRYYDFLQSMIRAAIDSKKAWLSESLIKAINFHAMAGLHPDAGQYRSYHVEVGGYMPPEHYRVPHLMEDLVNFVNWHWHTIDTTELASYALWGINAIHPFRNGNGRAARAVCYFIICVKSGGLLPGTPTVPALLRREDIRPIYVEALKKADNGDTSHLTKLVGQATTFQLKQASQS